MWYYIGLDKPHMLNICSHQFLMCFLYHSTLASNVQHLFRGFMVFKERLKIARTRAGFTQKQAGELIGIGANSYQKYELGGSEPNYERLIVLANAFDVSIDWLFCRDDFLSSHGVSFDE